MPANIHKAQAILLNVVVFYDVLAAAAGYIFMLCCNGMVVQYIFFMQNRVPGSYHFPSQTQQQRSVILPEKNNSRQN